MKKTLKSKKVLSMFLAMAMVFSPLTMRAMAADDTLVTTDAVDGLTVSVDYDTEKVYFEKVSDTEYNVLCDSTNGYYPFSFSMVMNDRSLVENRPTVTDGSFHWAYIEMNDEWVEDSDTPYGLATLLMGSASTITVNTSGNHEILFHCSEPNGGTSAAGSDVYAFLPAPGQFTNEGITNGGWGDIYDGNGTLKNNTSTGVSLGFFGGYVVYKFDNPVSNAPTNPYGADFIVYGNAFWNNSELGCVQVSQDGETWYDIAGSKYYDDDTTPNASITYTNPNEAEDASITTTDKQKSTLAPVNYTGSANGTIATNGFHNHSWFPLNANYFCGRNGNAAMDKVDALPFASRTVNNGVTSTLTLRGTMLGTAPTSGTSNYGFGYCDVHPNHSLGGNLAYNPYQTFKNASDYNSKTAGTSGGDPIDISWAVNKEGKPMQLSSIQYVRIYTGSAQMNGMFGEISTEALGVAACTGNGCATTTKDLYIENLMDGNEVATVNGQMQTVDEGEYRLYSEADYVLVNGVAVDAVDGNIFTMNAGNTVQIITQIGEESPYITALTCG